MIKKESGTLRYVHNVIINLSGHMILAVTAFILTPYLVRRMGTDSYALYSFLGIITGYLSIMALGTGGGAGRFVARFNARGEKHRVRQTAITALWVHLAGVFFGAAIFLLLRQYWTTYLLNVPESLHSQALWFAAWAALGAIFYALLQGEIHIFVGLQRFGWSNCITILSGAGIPIGAAVLIGAGFRLESIALWYVLLHLLIVAIGACILKKHTGLPVKDDWKGLDPDNRRDFMRFSLHVFCMDVLNATNSFLDKFIIGYFLPLSFLTYYVIPFALVQKLEKIAHSISVVTAPIAAELDSIAAMDRLRRVHIKSNKVVLLTVLPGFILLFAMAPQFLSLWLGMDFSLKSTWPLRFLVIARFFAVLMFVPSAIAMSTGHPRLYLKVLTVQSVLNIVGWCLLIPRFGITGAALATLIAQLIACPFLITCVNGVLKISNREYFANSIYMPCVAGAALLALAMLVHAHISDWAGLAAVCAAGCVLYFGISYLFLDSEEKEILKKILRIA